MPENPLTAVSSLYGPGAIAYWYLTALSVLVSWTVHPRKRREDSIDVDLIATLTLPCVAAGHLLWQISSLLKDCPDPQEATGAGCDVRQSAAVIEAPFVVVQTSSSIYTSLIIVGASRKCMRRAILASLVGAFCLAVESYMYLSASKRLQFLYVIDASTLDLVSPRRWFVAETWGIWNDVYSMVGVFTIATVCAGGLMLVSSAPRMAMPIQNDIEISQANSRAQIIEAQMDTRRVADSAQNISKTTLLAKVRRFGLKIQVKNPEAYLRHYVATAWVMSITISLLSAMTAIGPLVYYAHFATRHGNDPLPSQWRTFKSFTGKFARDYFPRTACSLEDLDQAVATAAGMTVFGFRTYDAARAYYRVSYSECVRQG